jgi:hypothetical protein
MRGRPLVHNPLRCFLIEPRTHLQLHSSIWIAAYLIMETLGLYVGRLYPYRVNTIERLGCAAANSVDEALT